MVIGRQVSVVALAGRRIDADGARPARFPLEHEQRVRDRVREQLQKSAPAWLVSSAASGADLLAQEVAGELGISRRVILPFGREQFRERSVVDRPGDWGPQFDRLMQALEPDGNVVDLHLAPDAEGAYTRANEAIIDEALRLAYGSADATLAVIVWEGAPRGSDDTTAAFAQTARARGIRVTTVPTT